MLNMKSRSGAFAAAFALVAAGCSESSQSNGIVSPAPLTSLNAVVVYKQIEFLGNPLVSEVTIDKSKHEQYNRSQPYNSAKFRKETEAFITGFGRPASLAATVGSVLYPDELIVDTSKDPATAGWLSWALAAGWGGRKLPDDVVDVGLSAIFSSLLDPAGAFCSPFQLPLCTDNVPSNDKAFQATFPYLATPHV